RDWSSDVCSSDLEDLLQEVAPLADLVGIEDHPGDLLEEDTRLDLPPQVGGVHELVVHAMPPVLRPGLHLDDEEACQEPADDAQGEHRSEDLPVADPAGPPGHDHANR